MSYTSDPDGSSTIAEDVHTKNFVNKLSSLIKSHEGAFACGGSIPMFVHEEPVDQGQASPSSTTPQEWRIALRWDPNEPSTPASQCKLLFPLEPSTSGNLEHLTATMSPATFVNLDPSQFSTDFCPYQFGIVDAVAQILLPTRIDNHSLISVKAELYKLNIYSGPSDHFRAPLDTPQSNLQFGSLVVCLPVTFEGGNLTVTHNGKTVKYDWAGSDSAEPTIQWAAFYSDCQHEVHQVQSGHRVTLTYNLYAVRGNGRLGGVEQCEAIDYASLPLYQHMKDLSAEELFMPSGGALGFYTEHDYPHSSNASFLPDALKGLDMAIWNVFQALGYTVYLRPVVHVPKDEQYGFENDEPYNVYGNSFKIEHINMTYDGGNTMDDAIYNYAGYRNSTGIYMDDVYWLNYRGHEELQFTYHADGNEALTEAVHSTCSILIKVPSYDERKSFLDKL